MAARLILPLAFAALLSPAAAPYALAILVIAAQHGLLRRAIA